MSNTPNDENQQPEAPPLTDPLTGEPVPAQTPPPDQGLGGEKAPQESDDPSSAEPLNEVEQLREEVDRYRDLALRAQADLDNYRKRVAREKEDLRTYANSALIEELLPVIDNFELGLAAAEETLDLQTIVHGMSMVQNRLAELLNSQGVTRVEANPGDDFDPRVHEAMAHEPHPTVPEGKITRQMRKGYKLRDRLLRPANVAVSKGLQET